MANFPKIPPSGQWGKTSPRLPGKKKIEHPGQCESRKSCMKQFLTLSVAVLFMAAYAASSFAEGSCGSCPVSGEKAKDKKDKEESVQS
jgi:hypothetical protein